MDTCIIQLTLIYADPYLSFLFLLLDYHWAHSIRLFDRFYHANIHYFIQLLANLLLILRIKAIRPLFDRLHIRLQCDLHNTQIAKYAL